MFNYRTTSYITIVIVLYQKVSLSFLSILLQSPGGKKDVCRQFDVVLELGLSRNSLQQIDGIISCLVVRIKPFIIFQIIKQEKLLQPHL